MPFDINQEIFDEDFDEQKMFAYQQELASLFGQSPEAKAFLEEDENYSLSWADTLVEFGLRYLEVIPPDLTPAAMREILYELFPQKVLFPDFDAVEAIHELRAFWNFLKREFGLENADACLNALDDKAIDKFDKAMNDPANFGISKSMFVMGQARGFDLSTEEGINKWMMTYNAELTAGTGTPVPFPGETGPQAAQARRQMKSALRKDRRKRKIAAKSRKQNRKKRK